MPRSSNAAFPKSGSSAAVFATTKWTRVLLARNPDSLEAREALGQLCQTYWYPLYAFMRRSGYAREDAQDLAQDFFARLLSQEWLARVDPRKGRFRSFLLAALKHFLANEWDKQRALKRGGGHQFVSFDGASLEARYELEPAHLDSPDKVFERRWALVLLDKALARFQQEHARDGKALVFETLKDCLTGSRDSIHYAEVARRLGVSVGALKVMVHRFRRRYREVLREEVAETVAEPAQIEDEMRYLLEALRS
jgi:RNA polymerase sigma-70 factor (ECF subfamily)